MFESKVDKMIEHFMFDTTQFYLVIKNGISMLRYQYMGYGEFTKDIVLKNIELNDTELALERLNNNQYPVTFLLKSKYFDYCFVIKKTKKEDNFKSIMYKKLFGVMPVSWVYLTGKKKYIHKVNKRNS